MNQHNAVTGAGPGQPPNQQRPKHSELMFDASEQHLLSHRETESMESNGQECILITNPYIVNVRMSDQYSDYVEESDQYSVPVLSHIRILTCFISSLPCSFPFFIIPTLHFILWNVFITCFYIMYMYRYEIG